MVGFDAFERAVMKGWIEEVELAEKRGKCSHKLVLWGADKKTGICMECGKDIKR